MTGVAHQSEPALLALHGARLKGFAEADAIAELVGLPLAEVEAPLAVADAQRWAKHRTGRLSGWMLTAAGKAADEAALAAELDVAGGRAELTEAYRRFLAHNAGLLELCTAWQTDQAGDRAALDRLAELNAAVQPVCDDVAALLVRFGSYGPRLDEACQRARAGAHDWFTKPTIDSYHTVWFELHEDLLATLGVERAREGAVS